MVPFPICHSEAGETSAPINIYTVPFHHADANDTHQRCGIRWWRGGSLKDRERQSAMGSWALTL